MSRGNNEKRQIENTEELRRVIDELKAKADSIEESESLSMALTSENILDESYISIPKEEDIANDGMTIDVEESMDNLEENVEDIEANIDVNTEENIKENETPVYLEEEERRNVRKVKSEEKALKKKRRRAKSEDVIISLDHVTKVYDKGVPALEDVNLKINKGEFVFVVGESGSGKSTLIRLLLRELKPTSGSIMVNGFRVDKLRQSKVHKLRRCMGVVFQDFRLLKDRNVYENVAFAQRIIQVPYREMKKNVPNMLSVVGLASKYKAKPNELSGGEQQRVALARALVNKPPILLADEPTGNLDPKTTIEIMNLLDQINKNGTTIIVVTHNDKIVNDMQKRVITIKNGVIVSDEKKGGYIDED